MSKRNWKVNEITVKEIAEHLNEFHSVDFSDRRSLSAEDFKTEHFPEDLSKPLAREERKKILNAIKDLVRRAIKVCEKKGYTIANVFWSDDIYDQEFNIEGFDMKDFDIEQMRWWRKKGEWRICKPLEEQQRYLKWKRYFNIIAGFTEKIFNQQEMVKDKVNDEELFEEIREHIQMIHQEKRKKRRKQKNKRK